MNAKTLQKYFFSFTNATTWTGNRATPHKGRPYHLTCFNIPKIFVNKKPIAFQDFIERRSQRPDQNQMILFLKLKHQILNRADV